MLFWVLTETGTACAGVSKIICGKFDENQCLIYLLDPDSGDSKSLAGIWYLAVNQTGIIYIRTVLKDKYLLAHSVLALNSFMH